MIPQFTIARIMDEARIEEVVGDFVVLKRKGANLWGNCPFHNEKTPSFSVSPAKNIFKCFGCGKGGDSVKFLMESQQLSYVEALRFLAKKYNIEVEEATVEESSEEKEKQSLIESIHIANGFAQKFFSDYMMNHESGRIGLAYFHERGFRSETIEKFQLGFAPDGYDVFTKHALINGYKLEVLKKAGLTSSKEDSSNDFFRNRVMFPVHNMTGKVVGFGGRIMVKNDKFPKYINTPESEAYQKSKLLYGAYFARNAVRKSDECYLVEGYTDVVSLHQAGIENVMASSGTSLTVEQVRLIKRMTQNITILYDGDQAGIKAALRGTDIILEEGMNVRVVILPVDEDPDSYVKKVGADAFVSYINTERKDLILFKSSLFASEAKSDPIKKADLIKNIVGSITLIPDNIRRAVYVKETSELLDVPEQTLITEINKIRRAKLRKEQGETPSSAVSEIEDKETASLQHKEQQSKDDESSSITQIERDILRLLIECGTWEILQEDDTKTTVAAHIFEETEEVEMEIPLHKELFHFIHKEFLQGTIHESAFYTSVENEKFSDFCTDLLATKYEASPNWWNKMRIVIPDRKNNFINEIEAAVVRLKEYHIKKMLKEVEHQLKEEKDEHELIKLFEKHKLLQKEKLRFAKMTRTIIYPKS
jgi:DNA primase